MPQLYLTAGLREIWHGPSRHIALMTVVFAILVLFALSFAGPPSMIGEEHRGAIFVALTVVGLASVGRRPAYLVVLTGALMLFGGYRSLRLSAEPGARTRSYFGVYTVRSTAQVRELDHGTTVHGIQLRGSPLRERTRTTYYSPQSGVGEAMTLLRAIYGERARIGVVGLGTGTLSCYARPGQAWRFYEIDPAIIHIARDGGQFTYLRRCLPDPLIQLGDARISLQAEATASLDLLALDAFSSDAVPMHLMTREAFATYARVLAHDGLLLVHISNRFLDLEPVVEAVAREDGWRVVKLHYRPSALDPDATGSIWIALSREARPIDILRQADPDWVDLHGRPGFTAWTDDYATILPLLKMF